MSIVINDVAPRVHYIATAGQTVFAIPFEFLHAADIQIWINGVLHYFAEPPTENWMYSLTGIGVSGGGSATFGPPGRYAGEHVVIFRDMPVERTADLPTHGVFPVESLNQHLDALTAMVQQNEVNIEQRSLRLVPSDAPQSLLPLPLQVARANRTLAFDASGQPIAVDPLPGPTGPTGPVAITTSDTPPLGVQDNHLWWNSSTGVLCIYYDDGDSQQWVQVNMPGADGASMLSGAGVPDPGLGSEGDSYFNTGNGDLYTKTGGTWTATGNIYGTALDDLDAAVAAAEASAEAAQNAAEASFALGPKYVDEPTGRAASANGAVFLVVGSGDVAAHEYRRVDASSSTYLTSYPNAESVHAANEKGSYARFAEARAARLEGRPKALVLVLLGQSNNAGHAAPVSGVVSADAYMPVGGNLLREMMFYDVNPEHAIHWDDLASVVPHVEATTESPISGAITTVVGSYFRRIYGLSVAIGARQVHTLRAGGPRANLSAGMHRLCDMARDDGYEPIVAISAHHGEANMTSGTAEEQYYTDALGYYSMAQLYAAQAMEKPDYQAPIVFHHPIQMSGGTDGASARDVHTAIARLARDLPNAIYAGPSYHYDSDTDRIHQTPAGYRMRGEHLGHLLRQYFEKGIRETALHIVDVTWDGATAATVRFNEEVVRDTSFDWGTNLNTTKALAGFVWIDNGTQIQVTAVTVQGRKVVLTLASAPAGTVEQQQLRIASETTTGTAGGSNNRAGSQIRVDETGRASIHSYGDARYGTHYRWAVNQLCDVRSA